MTGFAARIFASVGEIGRASWDACLPREVENHAYYQACDEAASGSGIGLRCSAVAVADAKGIAAVAPFFRLDYRLDTPLQGRLRDIADVLYRHFPRFVALKIICIGSPYADRCHLGFAPRLDGAGRQAALQALVNALRQQAATEGAQLVAFKDLAPAEDALVAPLLGTEGFTILDSLPVAVLDLHYWDIDGYLASLSAATRKDIRRKLAKAQAVRIEHRSDITGLEELIGELYESTRCQSSLDYGELEILPPGYFAAVSGALGERAVFALYWIGDELAAFNLLLIESDRVIDKFLGMRYPLARDHNLYVISWMANVRFCLSRGIGMLQSGQTAYASKLRFGSRLIPSKIRFCHRNGLLQWVLGRISPRLSFARFDKDLAEWARRKPQERPCL